MTCYGGDWARFQSLNWCCCDVVLNELALISVRLDPKSLVIDARLSTH